MALSGEGENGEIVYFIEKERLVNDSVDDDDGGGSGQNHHHDDNTIVAMLITT